MDFYLIIFVNYKGKNSYHVICKNTIEFVYSHPGLDITYLPTCLFKKPQFFLTYFIMTSNFQFQIGWDRVVRIVHNLCTSVNSICSCQLSSESQWFTEWQKQIQKYLGKNRFSAHRVRPKIISIQTA